MQNACKHRKMSLVRDLPGRMPRSPARPVCPSPQGHGSFMQIAWIRLGAGPGVLPFKLNVCVGTGRPFAGSSGRFPPPSVPIGARTPRNSPCGDVACSMSWRAPNEARNVLNDTYIHS